MWYSYTMEYYFAVKKNEICRNMDGTKTIILREVTPTPNGKYFIFLLYVNISF